jgi:nicotianamine synthase
MPESLSPETPPEGYRLATPEENAELSKLDTAPAAGGPPPGYEEVGAADLPDEVLRAEALAGNLSPAQIARENRERYQTDPVFKKRLADAMFATEEQGFQLSDLSLPDMAKGAAHMGKSLVEYTAQVPLTLPGVPATANAIRNFLKRWDTSDAAIDASTKEGGTVFAAPLIKGALHKLNEVADSMVKPKLIAATEGAQVGMAELVKKGARKAANLVDFDGKTDEERAARLDDAIESADMMEGISKGEGVWTQRLQGKHLDEMKKKGVKLDPQTVSELMAGDPLTFYGFGKAFGAGTALIGASGRVIARAPTFAAAQATKNALRTAQVAKLSADARLAGIASAENATAAEAAAANLRAAKAGMTPTAKLFAGAEDLAGGIKTIPQKLVGASFWSAGKTGELVATVAKWAGKAAPAIGLVKGFAEGGPIGALAGLKAGEMSGKLIQAGAIRAGVRTAKVSNFGKSVYKDAATTPAQQATIDLAAGAGKVAGGASKGLAIDLGVGAATSESPEDTRGITPLGAIFGAAHAVPGSARHFLQNQLLAPRNWADTKPTATKPYGNFPTLDALHAEAQGIASEGVKQRLGALRTFMDPTGVEIYQMPSRGALESFLVEQFQSEGMTGGDALAQAKEFAGNAGLFTRLTDSTGKVRRVGLLVDPAPAPHEAFHGLEDVLGAPAAEALRDMAAKEYGPRWNIEGRYYANRLAGPTGGLKPYLQRGEDWQHAMLDASGGGDSTARSVLAAREFKAKRDAGAPITPEQALEAADAQLKAIPEGWRKVLSPEHIESAAGRYLASELVAENFDTLFKHENPGKPSGKSLPERFGRILANLFESAGADPYTGAESEGLRVQPKRSVMQAVKEVSTGVRDILGKTEKPTPGASKAPTEPPKPGAPEPVTENQTRAQEAAAASGDARVAELVNRIVENQKAGDAPLRLTYKSVKGLPGGAAEAFRTGRRSEQEAAYIKEGLSSMDMDTRNAVQKIHAHTRFEFVKGGKEVQSIGYSLEKLVGNVQRTVDWIRKSGNTELANQVPYERNTFGTSLSETGWNQFISDVQRYAENQQKGGTGAGAELKLPADADAMGVTVPAFEGMGAMKPIEQGRADFINMLMGFKLPETTRVSRAGGTPGNVVAQRIAGANEQPFVAPRVSEPATPRGEGKPFKGFSESIKEVNPVRQEFEAKGLPVNELVEVVERINLKHLDAVTAAPEVGFKAGVTDTIRAGFMPEKAADIIKLPAEAFRDETIAYKGKNGGGLTGMAVDLGAKMTEAQHADFAQGMESVKGEIKSLIDAGEFQSAMDMSVKGQFFREAIEAATGGPPAEFVRRKLNPEYRGALEKGSETKASEEDFALENDFAKRLLDGSAKIEEFPYYKDYEQTLSQEATLLPAGAEKVLFVGTGPVPLSAHLLAREGKSVTGLEIDPGAAETGRKVLAKLDTPASVLVGDATTFKNFGDYDAVVLALEAGATTKQKNGILANIREQMKPDAVLLARGAKTEAEGFPTLGDEVKNFKETGTVDTFGGLSRTARLEVKAMPEEGSDRPAFYSRLTRTVEQSPQGRASGAQWKATIKGSKLGASEGEMDLVGVRDLEDGTTYTKQEVLDYLKANEVVVKDVTLGEKPEYKWSQTNPETGKVSADVYYLKDANGKALNGMVFLSSDKTWHARYKNNATLLGYDTPQDAMAMLEEGYGLPNDVKAHFSNYQLPGGKEGSYREVLLTVPSNRNYSTDPIAAKVAAKYGIPYGEASAHKLGAAGADNLEIASWMEGTNRGAREDWKDGHSNYSSIANPIVRLRFNERTTAGGKRMLFLEEVQAPQKGEFEKMPKLFQDKWRDIAFKWALRHAAENGFEAVGWTTGEQQAARYDLSKQVTAVHYNSESQKLTAENLNARVLNQEGVTQEKLSDYIGKDAAAKLMTQAPGPTGIRTLRGDDLKVGGEGLAKLYDSDFRNVVNSLPAVKKSGQKVGTSQIVDGEAFATESFNAYLKRTGLYTDEGRASYMRDRLKTPEPTVGVHSLDLTPAIRDSVMAGQAAFMPEGTTARTLPVEGKSEFWLRPDGTVLQDPNKSHARMGADELGLKKYNDNKPDDYTAVYNEMYSKGYVRGYRGGMDIKLENPDTQKMSRAQRATAEAISFEIEAPARFGSEAQFGFKGNVGKFFSPNERDNPEVTKVMEEQTRRKTGEFDPNRQAAAMPEKPLREPSPADEANAEEHRKSMAGYEARDAADRKYFRDRMDRMDYLRGQATGDMIEATGEEAWYAKPVREQEAAIFDRMVELNGGSENFDPPKRGKGKTQFMPTADEWEAKMAAIPEGTVFTRPVEEKNNPKVFTLEARDPKGRQLGYVTSKRLRDGSAEITMVYVDPEYRGQGIGESLVSQAAEHWITDGATAIAAKTVSPEGKRLIEKTLGTAEVELPEGEARRYSGMEVSRFMPTAAEWEAKMAAKRGANKDKVEEVVQEAEEAIGIAGTVQLKQDKKLPGSMSGVLKLIHFGASGLTETNPQKMGSGIATPTDMQGAAKTYFFNEGSKMQADITLRDRGGKYGVRVDGNGVYDLNKDVLDILSNPNRWARDETLKKAGYTGFHVNVPDGREVTILYKPVAVTPIDLGRAFTRAVSAPGSKFMPEQQDTFLGELGQGQKEYDRAALNRMTVDDLKAHYPEAIVGRPKGEEISSNVEGSPLAKKAGSREKAIKAFSDKLVEFYKQNEGDPALKAGEEWYSKFTPLLKKEFGKDAPIFAELLAATSPQTNPEVNFGFAYDAYQNFKSGNFDKQVAKFVEGLAKLDTGELAKVYARDQKAGKTKDNPANPSDATYIAHWIDKHDLVLRGSGGNRFGLHSVPVLRVLARKWLDLNSGPKTANFVKNLLGTGDEATIDIWADRTMRRVGYEGFKDRWRILPENVQSVTEADFAFSQEAFSHAAGQLGLKPSALQGALWFAEKKLWSDKGWGRLDLGDYRAEMAKIPLLKRGAEQRQAHQKAMNKAKTMEEQDLFQSGLDVRPRMKQIGY